MMNRPSQEGKRSGIKFCLACEGANLLCASAVHTSVVGDLRNTNIGRKGLR